MEILTRRHKVVFFGTPDFAVPALDAVYGLNPPVDLVGVVKVSEKPVGREKKEVSSPAKLWAEAHGVRVFQPENLRDTTFMADIAALAPDVGVMTAFGKILPPELLQIFPRGILNIHPSLLPRWRGPSPIQAVIAAGDQETGVTIHLTDPRVDAGAILTQESYPLHGTETVEELTAFLAQRGAELLSKTLLAWLRGDAVAQPQKEDATTIAKALTRADGRVQWEQPVDEVLRRLRAYARWPGIFTELPDGARLKILEASAVFFPEEDSDATGTIREDTTETPIVRTAKGWLRLTRVQLAGKTVTDGASFLRGHRDLLGKKLS